MGALLILVPYLAFHVILMRAPRRLRTLPPAPSPAAGQTVPRRTRVLAAAIEVPAPLAKRRRQVLEPDKELNEVLKPTALVNQDAGLEAGAKDEETTLMQKQRGSPAGGRTAICGADEQASDGTTSSDDEVTAARSRQLHERGKARQRRYLRMAEDLPGTWSLLEELSVGKNSMEKYKDELKQFGKYVDKNNLGVSNDAEIDLALVLYMNLCYLIGEMAWKGEKLMAAMACRLPEPARSPGPGEP